MAIQPTAREGVPPLPPSSTPKSDNLKDVAGKVSKATGSALQQAPPTTASFPTTAVAAIPLTPDPQKIAATVKQH